MDSSSKYGKGSYEFNDKIALTDAFKIMTDFRRESVFTDVVICTDDNKQFTCHKLVLASASSYFRAMFLADMKECQETHITIRDVDSIALEQLIEFCYRATVTITHDNVQQLLVASGMLQFTKVQKLCMEYLLSNLDEANCLGIWKLAEVIPRNETIVAKIESFVKTNFLHIAQYDEFLDLTAERLLKFLKSDELRILNENDLVTAIIRWVKFDQNKRILFLEDLMKYVRFSQITRRYLIDILDNELIVGNEFCRELIIDSIRYHLLPETRKSFSEKMDGQRERISRYLYLLGGEDCGNILSNVECYDCSTGDWHELTPMIIPRKFVGTAILDGQLYAVGGINNQYGDLVTVEACNISTNHWSSLAPLQNCKGSIAVAVLDGWLYVAGGTENGEVLKSVERYDCLSNNWLPVPHMSLPRSHFCLQPVSGKIYAIGGYCGSCTIPHVEFFDPLSNMWTEVACMNKPRMHHASTHHGKNIYVVGGANKYAVLNSVELLDVESNTWSLIRNCFNPRSGLRAEIMKTERDNDCFLWIIGGHDHKNRNFSTILKLRVPDLSYESEISMPRTCVFAGQTNI